MHAKTKKALQGVITALGTPLDDDNNLHEEGMRRQVAAQITAGVNGLLCLGTMGMAQMHTPEVREQAIRVTTEEARGRIPVLVGCGDCSTARTMQYISVAEKYGPDGIVLITDSGISKVYFTSQPPFLHHRLDEVRHAKDEVRRPLEQAQR